MKNNMETIHEDLVENSLSSDAQMARWNELKNVKEPIFLVGDGSIVCYNALEKTVENLILPPEHRMHQQAVGVALAAQKLIDAGLPGDGAQLNPNYLRLSQAERERQEKESREKENKL